MDTYVIDKEVANDFFPNQEFTSRTVVTTEKSSSFNPAYMIPFVLGTLAVIYSFYLNSKIDKSIDKNTSTVPEIRNMIDTRNKVATIGIIMLVVSIILQLFRIFTQ